MKDIKFLGKIFDIDGDVEALIEGISEIDSNLEACNGEDRIDIWHYGDVDLIKLEAFLEEQGVEIVYGEGRDSINDSSPNPYL